MIREGIVNALVHRDYDIAGAKCQLRVDSDKIEIWSPGQPVSPITLEQLQSFNAPTLSRNPVLHYVFAKMKLAEERGLGQKSMREKAKTAGLPLPKYTWNDPYLVLTIFRSVTASVSTLPLEIQKAATRSVRIDMALGTDSLNVSVAAGIILHNLRRVCGNEFIESR